jgi:hypothetical protein
MHQITVKPALGTTLEKTEALSNGKNRSVRPRVYTECRAAGRHRVGYCKRLARDRGCGSICSAASPMIKRPAAQLIPELKNGDERLLGAEFELKHHYEMAGYCKHSQRFQLSLLPEGPCILGEVSSRARMSSAFNEASISDPLAVDAYSVGAK